MLTAKILAQLCPRLPSAKAQAIADGLGKAMQQGGVTTPARMSAFLAQVLHESGEFRYSEELWGPTAAQLRYEGRVDGLGNTMPGDGHLFRGRGYIQITGRANYGKYGKKLGLDLVKNPDLASQPEAAAAIAVAYWVDHGLNELADRGDFREITRRINGGYNNLAERERYYAKAKALLKGSEAVFLTEPGGKVVEWDGKPGAVYGGQALSQARAAQMRLIYPAGTETKVGGVKLKVANDGALILNKN